MSNELTWEDPPKSVRGRLGWRPPIVEQLKERPGVWAVVEPATHLTTAGSAWSKLGCEATARKQPDGTYKVWARWPADDTPDDR